MKISAESKISCSEKERIDLIYKKSPENKMWQCMYKYAISKAGTEFTISSVYFFNHSEYSAVLYAVRQAESDVKKYLHEKGFSYHKQLLDDVWNKYIDTHQSKLFSEQH